MVFVESGSGSGITSKKSQSQNRLDVDPVEYDRKGISSFGRHAFLSSEGSHKLNLNDTDRGDLSFLELRK